MTARMGRTVVAGLLFVVGLLAVGCSDKKAVVSGMGPGPERASLAGIEVTAKLVEIPEGAIFNRPLYNYATVLKYDVITVHRGRVKGQTIYVGHYNPAKPRAEAADERVPDVGGTLKSFRAGQVHKMALEESMFDNFTGGILNLYSKEDADPIYWAVWTEPVSG
jgi:hypothetical protein